MKKQKRNLKRTGQLVDDEAEQDDSQFFENEDAENCKEDDDDTDLDHSVQDMTVEGSKAAEMKKQVLNKVNFKKKQKEEALKKKVEQSMEVEVVSTNKMDDIWNQSMKNLSTKKKTEKDFMDTQDYVDVSQIMTSINSGADYPSHTVQFFTDDKELLSELSSLLNEVSIKYQPNSFRFWLPANADIESIKDNRRIYIMFSVVCFVQKTYGSSAMGLGKKQAELCAVVDLLANQIRPTKNNGPLIRVQTLDKVPVLKLFARHAFLQFIK